MKRFDAHEHRRSPPRQRVKTKPDSAYVPGHFLQPVLAWKQMRFKSQIVVDPKTRRFASEFVIARMERAA